MSTEIKKLIGQIFNEVVKCLVGDNDALLFRRNGHTVYTMTHMQDCCEAVQLAEIHGDLSDLTGTPILSATEETEEKENESGLEGWTFYQFRTAKGYVTLRWIGDSNGDYAIGVSLYSGDIE